MSVLCLEEIIEEQVLSEFFQGDETSPEGRSDYDFFMGYPIEEKEELFQSDLCTKWDFNTCEEYGELKISDLKIAMKNMYSSLEYFAKKVRSL